MNPRAACCVSGGMLTEEAQDEGTRVPPEGALLEDGLVNFALFLERRGHRRTEVVKIVALLATIMTGPVPTPEPA